MANSIGLQDALFMADSREGNARQVVIEDEDFAELTLSDNGLIRECNKAFERLFGFTQKMLLWQHVSMLLPQLAGVAIVREGEINHRLHYLAHIGHRFEMLCLGGGRRAVRICLNDGENSGRHYVRLTLCPVAEERTQ